MLFAVQTRRSDRSLWKLFRSNCTREGAEGIAKRMRILSPGCEFRVVPADEINVVVVPEEDIKKLVCGLSGW